MVTFSYKSIIKATPVFAVIETIRSDLSWQDVVANHMRDRPHFKQLNSTVTVGKLYTNTV